MDEKLNVNKVHFDDFYIWRQYWYENKSCNERLGQDFCNRFHETIGRGEHTRKLFYSVDDLYSEKLIYLNFIDWSGDDEKAN